MQSETTKFTPGPWAVEPVPTDNAHVIYAVDRDSPRGYIGEARFIHDARLIAAAPDLLEVLRDVEWSAQVDVSTGGYAPGCPWCEGNRDDDEEYKGGHQDGCKLADAIAKALGS